MIVLHQLVDQHRPEARALVRRGLWNQNFLETQDFEFVNPKSILPVVVMVFFSPFYFLAFEILLIDDEKESLLKFVLVFFVLITDD